MTAPPQLDADADADAAAHPDVAAEQARIDHAYDCLRVMRERAEYLKSLGYQGGNIHADTGLTPEMAAADDARKQRRIDSLAEPATALCFGRIDRADGERFYIGRRHVEDGDGEPVVTDWRVPVAIPFYRATVVDRLGLDGRRRFVIEGRDLFDIFEEHLGPNAAAAADGSAPNTIAGSYVPDPLLAEVERSRTGSMRDIVATIQAEQDAIIRAPLEACIVVQGGPGTGKTAVGLHRVAFLLYTHREQLERERILILGPNKIFFRYISQVLPSLGETAGVQLTIAGLTGGRFRVVEDEAERPEVAALKGDVRMATVIRNAAVQRITGVGGDEHLPIRTPFGSVSVDAADVTAIIDAATADARPLNAARAALREQLVDLAWKVYRSRYGSDVSVWSTFVDGVRAEPTFKKTIDRLWPTLSAVDVVRRLYGNRRALDRAAVGILDDHERELLVRKPASKVADERWTIADLAVLDEAEDVLNGTTQQYGHIVVDEAQDLSEMHLRMVARRARRGSMTILGDLAQATVPGGQRDWRRAIEVLGAPATTYDELTVGYRVPAPILDVANLLLAEAAPGVRPTSSARTRGDAPKVLQTSASELAATLAAEAAELQAQWESTAVVVPASMRGLAATALAEAGVDFTDGLQSLALGEHVTLLTPPMTKGLEFDAVLVLEPGRIVGEHANGVRLLFVVLTRAVHAMTLVATEPLPEALRAGVEITGAGDDRRRSAMPG